MPHLLINGIREAICASKAKVVFVLNLMTKRGETDSFKASNYIQTLAYYLGDPQKVDFIIANSNGLSKEILDVYKKDTQRPVEVDSQNCQKTTPKVKIISTPLATYYDREHLLRHNPEKLAKAILGTN